MAVDFDRAFRTQSAPYCVHSKKVSVLTEAYAARLRDELESADDEGSSIQTTLGGAVVLQILAVLATFGVYVLIEREVSTGALLGMAVGLLMSAVSAGVVMWTARQVVDGAEFVEARLLNIHLAMRYPVGMWRDVRPRELYAVSRAAMAAEHGVTELRKLIPSILAEEAAYDDTDSEVEDSDGEQIPAPEGVITAVFTDIQSSTQLWERCGEAMNEALSLHNQVIRKQLRLCHGYEVKTIGDAFMCTFSSPVQAVRFALRVQEDLLKKTWPLQLEECEAAHTGYAPDGSLLWSGLRVRIGAHMGPAILELNPLTERADYRGPTINVAARVEAQSKGGMLMVTNQLFEAVKHMLPELGDPACHEVGTKSLKGVKEPVRLVLMLPRDQTGRWSTFNADSEAKPERPAATKLVMTPFGAIEAPVDPDDLGLGGRTLTVATPATTLTAVTQGSAFSTYSPGVSPGAGGRRVSHRPERQSIDLTAFGLGVKKLKSGKWGRRGSSIQPLHSNKSDALPGVPNVPVSPTLPPMLKPFSPTAGGGSKGHIHRVLSGGSIKRQKHDGTFA
eukprot:Hpha_TRINITY_DN15529_c2_g2::TRINITY_DN15529_c2_g2_i1::g.105977::m.105977